MFDFRTDAFGEDFIFFRGRGIGKFGIAVNREAVRINRPAEFNFDLRRLDSQRSPRPDFVKSVDRNWKNRDFEFE